MFLIFKRTMHWWCTTNIVSKDKYAVHNMGQMNTVANKVTNTLVQGISYFS